MTTCDYCDSEELAYELKSDRGTVARCIPCLAVEQGSQQLNMRFERFVDFEADSVVYDSTEQLRESRKHSYDSARDWYRILGRIRQDDPILKRDPDDIETVHDHTREFITNIMGATAHYSPSEIIEADGDPAQMTLGGEASE